jgi:O-antigen/teichoic acid export membrane protein
VGERGTMIPASSPEVIWGEVDQTRTVAKNVSTRYASLGVELVLGLLMLPFNTHYLGPSEYGLWVLAASIVAYFPVLDLGYGVAMERFVAHYRARKDHQAISEIASTLVMVFTGIGIVAFLVISVIAAHLGGWFDLDPAQARTGRLVMLFVGLQFAGGLPFAIFGAVVNGFQRTYLNAIVSTTVSLTVAAVNVTVVLMGGTLVELVGWMTLARLMGYVAYRLNAYRVFPLLHVRPTLFRKERLREVTGFSVYMMMQDASNKVNYATDPVIIAAALMPGAVAIWTVAQRLADVAIQLTNQLNYVLLPIVVDYDTAQRDDRLQDLLVQGTRFSLATTLPVAGTMALLAEPVVVGWTGPTFAGAAKVLEILALVVIVRVGSATASTMLQGAGRHRLVAGSNIAAASVNVALSILLVYPFGLPGVAIATLIPISLRAAVILIPSACRRVGLPLLGFVRAAIWPAVWPTALALTVVLWLRPHVSSLGLAVLVGVAAAIVYATFFVGVAIGSRDRSRYLLKLRNLAGRPAVEVT